ncbi:MAG TPA: alpha/beta hydrolase [Candidatus Acidoferrales bacterium]|nr:alpha/beta hydrolase [Candidatus Acidoferrales bacterium]
MRRLLKWTFRIAATFVALVCLVIALFSCLSHRRETKSAVEAAPVTGHFVAANDTEIYFQEAGSASGRAIVLIHGTGAWSEIWRETTTALADSGFHAIAIDVPPFGYSGKPAGVSEYSPHKQAGRIVALLDALHIERATIVGHSVGARPAVELCLDAPSRVDALVLVDPALGFASDSASDPHFEQNHPSWLVRAFFGVKPLRNSVVATFGTNPLFIGTIFRSFVSRKESVTPERVEMLQRPLVVEGATRSYGDWLEYLVAAKDVSLVSDLANLRKLSAPTLVLWGSADTVTPLWQGQQLVGIIPDSKLMVMDNVGHIPYIENPEEFNRVLLGFLTRTPAHP